MDAAGNQWTNTSFYIWMLDTVPPLNCNISVLAPRVFSPRPNQPSSSITWTKASIMILQVSSFEAMFSILSHFDSGPELSTGFGVNLLSFLSSEGAHRVEVRLKDVAGNSLLTPCSVAEWILDVTPPVVQLSGLLNGSTIRSFDVIADSVFS